MNTPEKAIVAEFIRRVDGALKGQGDKPLDLLHERVEAQIIGSTPISGRFPTKEVFLGVVGQSVLERIKPATWSVRLLSMLGTGARVATALAIDGETLTGQRYNARGWYTGGIFEVKDNMIVGIWLFPDTLEVETVLFGRRLVPNA